MRRLALLTAAAVLALAGSAHAAPVSIEDFQFNPDAVTVQPGDPVQWTNTGLATHTVTSDSGSGETFNSGNIASGGPPYTHFFNTPGSFAYHCAIHPSMHGSVKVAGIAGRVVADSDGSGTLTAADTGLADVIVTVYDRLTYNQDPNTAPPITATQTDSDGRYSFDYPSPPSFGVAIEVSAKPGFDTPAVQQFQLDSTHFYETNFVFIGQGTVSGTVWNDVNGNGAHDAPEAGKSGATISLSGKRSATTDDAGNYSFANAVPGPGTVSVTAPSGFAVTGSASRPIDLQGPDYTAGGQDFFVQQTAVPITGGGGDTTPPPTLETTPPPSGPTAGNDLLRGTPGNDTIFGLGGNDSIDGRAGNDRLNGGKGNDRIIGGTGNDTLIGGPGKDTLIGGKGNDKLTGNGGKDSFAGGPGKDTIDARDGIAEKVDCGPGRDRVKADRKDKLKACESRSR